MQVPIDTLTSTLLTRTITMRDQVILTPLDEKAATASRDALAKTLYAQLFDWVVAAINDRIGGTSGASSSGSQQPQQQHLQ